MTPIESLHRNAKAHPKDIALINGDDIWTYQRLAGAVEQLARGLARRGLRPGDRVALHMANTPELAIAYYACMRVGAIAAPLNTRFKAAELKTLLQRLQPALYVGQSSLYREVAGIEAAILPPDARVIVDAPACDPMSRSWASLFADDTTAIVPTPDVDAPAVLLTTSGTTGQPKFVAHSPASLSAVVAALGELTPAYKETAVMTVPMVHASGLFTLLGAARNGAAIVLLERFDADAALDAVERCRANWLLGLPFMFAALTERQKARARDLTSLRRCFVCGDVCPLPLQQQFPKVFGIPLHNILGSTEALGSLTCGLGPGPRSQVTQGAEVRLIDENGTPVTRGEPGELIIRGPNITIGYWLSPGRIESALQNGWFHTGDLLREDEGGELWFVSRNKDLIVRGGSNISPVEVEGVLAAHPAVREAAVVGVPDAELGQRVVAVVQLAPEMQNKIGEQILADVAPLLADYKMPERLKIVGEISRNALGKIDRRALLAVASDR